MYQPMKDSTIGQGDPQVPFLPPASYPQGGFPPQGAYHQAGISPQSGFPPQVGLTPGGVPPQGLPQDGFPPQIGFPQAGLPPQGFPQGGYPPQEGKSQGAYPPPQPGFQPGIPNQPYVLPDVPVDFGEDNDVKGFDFTEKSIRRGFIRKVYAILMTQLLVSLAFISVFTFHEPTKIWVLRHTSVVYMALIVTLLCVIVMACCEDVRRKAPMNFIFLSIFTLAESLLLGIISSIYDSKVVMMAVGFTAAICLALTLFAMQTRFDFTVMGGALLCALVVLTLFGLIMIFIPKSRTMTLVYASIGVLLFSFYLIYDTQLMMGGKHKYTVSPEEYIFAALSLYLDVVNIFLFILRIAGSK